MISSLLLLFKSNRSNTLLGTYFLETEHGARLSFAFFVKVAKGLHSGLAKEQMPLVVQAGAHSEESWCLVTRGQKAPPTCPAGRGEEAMLPRVTHTG